MFKTKHSTSLNFLTAWLSGEAAHEVFLEGQKADVLLLAWPREELLSAGKGTCLQSKTCLFGKHAILISLIEGAEFPSTEPGFHSLAEQIG